MGYLSAEADRLNGHACPLPMLADLNYHTSIGHDASVGDFAVLSPYASLIRCAHIAEDVFIGMHASVGPGKRVGTRSEVSADSCVLNDAPVNSIVFNALVKTRVSVPVGDRS